MEESSAILTGCTWPTPSEISLAVGEIHIWCAGIDLSEDMAAGLLDVLSDDERQRAARYLLERPRRRFIGCRAAQRLILAQYIHACVGSALARPVKFLASQAEWSRQTLSDGPAHSLRSQARTLEFVYSALGKPALVEHCNTSGRLRFNVSNSGDMALFAIALDRELGVDVERIRDNLDHAGLAERYFDAGERDKLRRLPEAEQLAGFFDCWTRKEAFLKAIGKGLTFPLDRAVVSVGRSEPCRLLALDGDESAAAAWSLLALEPAPGYIAAIATPGSQPRVRSFRWDWSLATAGSHG